MKLTDIACRSAKPRNKPYKLSDGQGLYLLVKPTGKYWRLKYTFAEKENTYAIGVYPIIGLGEARLARDAAKRLLAQGIAPNHAKAEAKREIVRKAQDTFKANALEWFETKKSGWSASHTERTQYLLEKELFPALGNRQIAQLREQDLLEALRRIEARGALDLAGRCRQVAGQVFRHAIILGRCDRNPAIALQGALKTRKAKHFAAIKAEEIPSFVSALERNAPRLFARTKRAVMLSMLTMLRPGEIRNGRWSEINFEEALWVIPASRMKMDRDHIVPLSRQALAILREQKLETGLLNPELIFPSQVRPKEPMSEATVLRAVEKLGFKGRMTAHGFRALARTTIAEKLGYPGDPIELQLAHRIPGVLGEAYNRAQYLEQRKQMLQDWADYIERSTTSAQILELQQRSA